MPTQSVRTGWRIWNETRPAKSGYWSYVFFIDFDGHQSEPRIESVLNEVRKVAMEVRSLGSYPQAVV